MQNAISVVSSYLSKLLFRARPTHDTVQNLSINKLHSLARYDGSLPYHDEAVRALVWELKYYADSHAANIAGGFLAETLLAEASDVLGAPLLIPMPMHPKRRRERGHNQTEVLCKAALKHAAGIEYVPSGLKRIKETAPQQGLERHERLSNLKGSMKADACVNGRVCIVVDDVTTTGASFAEAKRALKAAGASEVRCVALARS
jgi:ComF family protein